MGSPFNFLHLVLQEGRRGREEPSPDPEEGAKEKGQPEPSPVSGWCQPLRRGGKSGDVGTTAAWGSF